MSAYNETAPEDEMTETKTITTGTLLSLSSGKMLAENGFGDIQSAADVVLGEPTFTHMFASQAVADRLERAAKMQHPWTADEIAVFADYPSLDGLPRDQVESVIRDWLEQWIYPAHGRTCEIGPEPEHVHIPFTEGLPAKFGGAA